MRVIERTSQFQKDVKLMRRRGKDMQKLRDVISRLLVGEPLPPRFRDHPLQGRWRNYRDCHIESDWLLIYRQERDILTLVRTGTHADLFE